MGLVGATGIAAGAFALSHHFDSSQVFVEYWATVAVVCVAEAFLLIRRQAMKDSEPIWSPPTRRVAQAVTPAFLAALIAGVLFCRVRLPESGVVMLLVGVWMVLYGVAMHAAGFFMPRGVRVFGWGYALAGLAYLLYWFFNGPFWFTQWELSLRNCNLAMGVFFGGGHAAYGLYLYVTEKRGNVV